MLYTLDNVIGLVTNQRGSRPLKPLVAIRPILCSICVVTIMLLTWCANHDQYFEPIVFLDDLTDSNYEG